MTRLGLILTVAGPFLLGGCKQDEGERCQIDSDCAGGLVCCPPGELEGTCQDDCTGGGEGEAEAEAEGEDAGPVDGPPATDTGPADMPAPDAMDASPADAPAAG